MLKLIAQISPEFLRKPPFYPADQPAQMLGNNRDDEQCGLMKPTAWLWPKVEGMIVQR